MYFPLSVPARGRFLHFPLLIPAIGMEKKERNEKRKDMGRRAQKCSGSDREDGKENTVQNALSRRR